MLLEFLHDGVGHGHVLEHTLELRRELTAALSLGNEQLLTHIKI